jgi:hypothetical protein
MVPGVHSGTLNVLHSGRLPIRGTVLVELNSLLKMLLRQIHGTSTSIGQKGKATLALGVCQNVTIYFYKQNWLAYS